MSYLIGGGSIFIEGRQLPANTQPPASFINHIGHDYFRTMGIPIVRGRAFTEDDEREVATTRRFAIVNESFAATYWPGQDAVGKRFHAIQSRRTAARSRRRRPRQQIRRRLRVAASLCLPTGDVATCRCGP